MVIFRKLINFFSKRTWILLLCILVLGLIVRLYHFSYPVADWHSWRQVDTSAVSRNFVEHGFDLLHPRFEDISNVPSGIENPNGYRFVEFPIYNILQAGGFLIFKTFTLEEWGRLVSIFGSLLGCVFIYLITKKYANKSAGFFAAFFYATLPFNIYYGRTLLPDTLMTGVTLGAIYFFDKWAEAKKFSWTVLAILFIALALLLKPFAGFFLLPLAYISIKEFRMKIFTSFKLWIVIIASIAPLIFWRVWMMQYPEGIAKSAWLFNDGNIRFTGAFFNWLFARRIATLILGFWGVAIFIIGLIAKQRNKLFFVMFIFSSLIYMFVIARGNVQHGYYQIPIIPSIALFLGIGSDFLLRKHTEYFSRWLTIPVYFVCIIFMFAFSWFNCRTLFYINNSSIVPAGQAVDKLTPKNAKIVAPYGGDTTLLYYTHRQGWPSFEFDLSKLIEMGADYLVLVNPKPNDYNIGKKYKIVSATNDYILFDLHKKP